MQHYLFRELQLLHIYKDTSLNKAFWRAGSYDHFIYDSITTKTPGEEFVDS